MLNLSNKSHVNGKVGVLLKHVKKNIDSLSSQIHTEIYNRNIQMKIYEDQKLILECSLNLIKRNDQNWNTGLARLSDKIHNNEIPI